MTEHDRGAYTPTPDAPLQFDARGAYKRKPMPMTLIGSGAVLAVLVGALALHYRHDTKAGSEPRPVGAPIAAVKTAAPPAPAAAAPSKDTTAAPSGAVDVFGGSSQLAQNTAQNAGPNPAGKAPTFTPPPEAPAPRTSLKVQTMDNTPPKVSPLATTAAPQTALAATALAATALATSAKPAPTKVPAKTPAAPPAKPTALAKAGVTPGYHAPGAVAATAAAPAAKPDATSVIARIADSPPPKPGLVSASTAPTSARSAAAVFGGAMVQIGAFSSMSLSDKGWSDVSALMGAQMTGKLKRVEAVEKDGKTFYRTSVTGFPNREAASAFCRTLSTKHFDCFAKG